MRLYYNDSSQVKKCLNYEEFTSEYCVCLCLHKTCQIMREKTPSKYGNHFSHLKQTTRWFDDNEMYTSRYKMDFKTPHRTTPTQHGQQSIAHLNREKACPIKKSTDILYDSQKKSFSYTIPANEDNGYVSDKRVASFRQPGAVKVKPKSNELPKANLKTNQTLPTAKRIFPNLKDHFPDVNSVQSAKQQQQQHPHQNNPHDTIQENPSKNKFLSTNSMPNPITSSVSLFSDIHGEGESSDHLTQNKPSNRVDFKCSNKTQKQIMEENEQLHRQINKAYFVENLNTDEHPYDGIHLRGSSKSKHKNVCKHINLVCEVCVRNFNSEKHKLYQFDLANLSKNKFVQTN